MEVRHDSDSIRLLQDPSKQNLEQDVIVIFEGKHWRLELLSSVSTESPLPVGTPASESGHCTRKSYLYWQRCLY